MTSDTRTMLRLVGSTFLLFFLGFQVLAAPFFWDQYKTLRNWTPVQAKVISSDVVPITIGGKHGYDVQIQFMYPVGNSIVSTMFRSNHPTVKPESKQAAAAEYPAGSTTNLLYDPLNPTKIRLHPGYNLTFFATPALISGLGLGCLVLGVICFAIAGRSRPAAAVGH